jgi:CheY-like chemotaxis protein
MTRILMVDDSEIDRLIVERMLAKAEPNTSFLGLNSFEHFKNWMRDNELTGSAICFVDLNLPDIKGYDLVSYVESTFPKKFDAIKFYILSASPQRRDKDLVDKLSNIEAFLTKPIDIQTLRNIVQSN